MAPRKDEILGGEKKTSGAIQYGVPFSESTADAPLSCSTEEKKNTRTHRVQYHEGRRSLTNIVYDKNLEL